MSKTNSITYTTNKEYRKAVREFCKMNCVEPENTDDTMDEETKDELNYDTSMMEKGMEEWFLKTNTEESNHLFVFKDLYLSAAGRMFSTDLRIGQAVICSYDTFHLYYACSWALYHKYNIESLSEYQTLRKWFS